MVVFTFNLKSPAIMRDVTQNFANPFEFLTFS